MIRVQFSLRTVFVVMTACALLLAWWVPPDDEVRFAVQAAICAARGKKWWVPPDDEVRFAGIYFTQWRPSISNLRITNERQFFQMLGHERDPGVCPLAWPDFFKSDVIPVPLNGLAGEPTAEHRIAAFDMPVDVDFHNMPLQKAVEVLSERCGMVELELDLREFDLARVAPEMPITFQAKGVVLRDALHSMLEPRGLTIVVVADEVVCITTESKAQSPYYPGFLSRGSDWHFYCPPALGHRLRFRGKLVLITSFAGTVEPDSRAVGYTVPKGAKVLFVSERIANAMDAGYTLMVLLMAAALIAYPKRRRGRCQQGLAAMSLRGRLGGSSDSLDSR
jgi:hypothetical protein